MNAAGEISLGSATSATIAGHTTPEQAVADIRSGKWSEQIHALRSAIGDERDRLKKHLPAFLWSGKFSQRNKGGLIQHSGLICADIDKVPERIAELHDTAQSDPHAVAAFVSPTGTGLKIVFRADDFNAVRTHVASHYKAQVDEAAKDVSRLCFVSHDPAAFYNADAVPLEVNGHEVSPKLPKVLPAVSVTPSTRTQIAEKILGVIDEDGFCKCPGEHLHTSANGPKDCMVMLDGAPTVKCFHGSCAGIVNGVNHELRSQIGKAEVVPARAPQAAKDPLPGNEDTLEQIALKPPRAKSLGDLKRRTADDPNELLRTGYLCRCAGLLIAAPSGIGKSSLAIMAMILWAIGRAIFGITPVRPMKSLLIQAENDDGDLAEMRDGVVAGMDLTDEEKKTALQNVIVVHENTRTGREFTNYTVAPLLELHRPDLLWIDPALAYLGGDVSSQKDVGFFLRNLLNPLLTKFNCGCVVVHHTNKPSRGEEKSAWQAGDFAYLGSGSAEWANWARAVLAIRSIGSHEVFELRAGKRGARIGWKDDDGKTSFARLIGHATEPGVICWRPATEDETPAGRPRRAGTREDLTALVPLERTIAKALLIDQWKDRYGNKDKGRAFLESLIADGKLFEWRLTRTGTNAAKLICRKPQPAE